MPKFTNFLGRLVTPMSVKRMPTLPQLIDDESKIGGTLFGTPSKGVSRRFFLDEGDSWFFSESAVDESGRQLYSFTIRYQILEQGVLKSVDGRDHVFIQGIELANLIKAVDLYEAKVVTNMYAPVAA